MLSRGASLWRGLQRAAPLIENRACNCCLFRCASRISRVVGPSFWGNGSAVQSRGSICQGFWGCSEAAGPSGRTPTAASATLLETGTASPLFDKIQPPPELGSTSGGSGGGAETGGGTAEETGGSGGIFSALGNAIFFGLVGAATFFGYYTYRYSTDQVATMVQETKKEENKFPGSFMWVPVMEWYVDQRHKLESEVKKYSDPPSDRLLPDLPPQARGIVRTLVLDLDDLLVHSDWTRGRGWRTFKRPGAEAFIRQMAQFYELVVYTSQLPTYADPILDRLDPNRFIQYRLYRDSTQYTHGHHVRDLSKLNRDLAKVLFITANPQAGQLQPDNTIVLKPWKLEAEDTSLLDMLPFLEAVMTQNVPDVRDTVVAYRGQDIPTAYRQRMKEIIEQRRAKASRGLLGGLRG